MGAKVLVVLVALGGGEAARQLRGQAQAADQQRGQRSLVNTFPFNSKAAADDHHHADHQEQARIPVQALDSPRDNRQGADDVSFPAVAAAAPGNDGKRCINKVEMVEETEYDEVEQCDHSYDRRCHTTYVTNYESECWTKQEEHDVEDDVVSCETIQDEKCADETAGYTTFTKCSKWPREVCSVTKKNVKKYTPITGCTKEPRELCAPAGCGFKEGAEECYDKTQT